MPYTYDQGRDFLKAEEIVRYSNPTFIGPTTGIQGLHHGAWWYYFLSIVFFIFNGWPEGFYYGIFVYTLLTIFLFFLFLKKNFHILTALLFLLIITVSPYFIRISFFPGNNILTPGSVLLFIYSVFMFLKTNQKKFILLLGLSIGFITETEVSFGIFLLPAFFLTAIFFHEFRMIIKNKIMILLLLSGIAFPFLPRVLFNLKNHFIEITDSIHFLKTTPGTNPQSYEGAIKDRINLMIKYYIDIIYEHNKSIGIAMIAGTLSIFIMAYKTIMPYMRKSAIFMLSIIVLTFFATLASKDNFFWDNYLEGIHYMMLFILLIGFEALVNIKIMKRYAYLIIAIFVIINATMFVNTINDKKKPETIGLRADMMTVDYVYRQTNNQEFCVRIYTPPIVPYTYDYIFSYYSKVKRYKEPSKEYKNNRCWYIFDKEPVKDRIVEWRKNNIPQNAFIQKNHIMENGVRLELWQIKI